MIASALHSRSDAPSFRPPSVSRFLYSHSKTADVRSVSEPKQFETTFTLCELSLGTNPIQIATSGPLGLWAFGAQTRTVGQVGQVGQGRWTRSWLSFLCAFFSFLTVLVRF
jgi:hypothetical protein